jgi:hypothetical protein
MPRQLLWCAPVVVGLGIAAGVSADKLLVAAEAAKQDVKPAVNLPITRVVLFNSGVGYFSRSGEIEGDARVDLSFPEQDINDLLKSMILEDFGGGRIAAVSYDSREPIGRTLSSFAINLNGQPTFASIVSQMRGERAEVVLAPGATNQPGKLSGVIVGVEQQRVAAGNTTVDAEFLNIWCVEGLRSVRLSDVQQLKFANPLIESEFRRALDVLALTHDSQKKAVALHFAGEKKRQVQVGYVVEAPIWKTSYRLVLADKEKPYLQGWAHVENTTDEDWAGVKMALISGRPISFQMDLHNPLYVDRPSVEPELFASLRPVTYRGGFNGTADERHAKVAALVRQYHELVTKKRFADAEKVAQAAKELDPDDPALGALAQMAKIHKRVEEEKGRKDAKEELFYRGLGDAEDVGPYVDAERRAGQLMLGGSVNTNQGITPPVRPIQNEWRRYWFNDQPTHLTPARIHGGILGDAPTRRLNTDTVGNAATAASLGDAFQYAIDHPVTLARQKSAMLPIVGKDIEGQKVSIYNPVVQRTHPLLGFNFKNTSGAHLNQGPITVFEGSVYAGDTRVLDVQPNEERLVSYAIDLGIEVDLQVGPGTQKITSVKAVKGVITTSVKLMEELKYRIVNRSQTDRTLLIEHPNRTNQQFKLVDTDKPTEDTPDVYRFQMAVKAGETKTFTVKEARDLSQSLTLTNNDDQMVRYFTDLTEASSTLKQKLRESFEVRKVWDLVRVEVAQVNAELERLNLDQDRIRKNLRETPKEAAVYSIYLKKLSDQEKELDALMAKIKKLTDDEFQARKRYDDFLANISD